MLGCRKGISVKSIGSSFVAVLGVLSILAVATSCSRPQKPEFKGLEQIELLGATLQGQLVFTADAVFFNPNSVGLDVTGMDLEVLINDKKVADVEQSVTLRAEASSDFKLPLEIRVPISEVYEDLGDLLGSFLSKKVVTLDVQGEVRVKVLGVTLGVPFEHREEHEIEPRAR